MELCCGYTSAPIIKIASQVCVELALLTDGERLVLAKKDPV